MNVHPEAAPDPKDALREQKRQDVREAALGDFGFFCRQIMRDPQNRQHVPLAPFHMEYCADLQSLGRLTGFRSLTLFPRAHLKTFLGDQAYAIWRYLHDPNVRIGIFNAVEDIAQSFLRGIRLELLFNDRLRYVFPELAVGERGLGNQDELTLPRKARLRDATFTAYGRGSTTAGHRYDLGIYDDIVPEPTADRPHTPEFLASITDWFYGTLFLRDSFEKSDVLVIGTRWHDADTYAGLLKDPTFHQFIRVIEVDGVPIWPDKWPIEAIISERDRFAREGRLDLFMAQMYQDPAPAGLSKLGNFKTYRDLPPQDELAGIIFATDPASSLSRKADFTAHVVLYYTKGRDVYVDYATEQRIDPSLILHDVFRLAKRYGPFTWAPEKVGFQDILRPLAYQKMIESGIFFSIDPVTRPNTVRKEDYILGAIEPYVNSGRLHIREGLVDLMRRLTRYPKVDHDDLPDALAMALTKIPPGAIKCEGVYFDNRKPYGTPEERMRKAGMRLVAGGGGYGRRQADEFMGSIN